MHCAISLTAAITHSYWTDTHPYTCFYMLARVCLSISLSLCIYRERYINALFLVSLLLLFLLLPMTFIASSDVLFRFVCAWGCWWWWSCEAVRYAGVGGCWVMSHAWGGKAREYGAAEEKAMHPGWVDGYAPQPTSRWSSISFAFFTTGHAVFSRACTGPLSPQFCCRAPPSGLPVHPYRQREPPRAKQD